MAAVSCSDITMVYLFFWGSGAGMSEVFCLRMSMFLKVSFCLMMATCSDRRGQRGELNMTLFKQVL